jgi:hypothetical protein
VNDGLAVAHRLQHESQGMIRCVQRELVHEADGLTGVAALQYLSDSGHGGGDEDAAQRGVEP